jgi:phage terminase small subunit
VKPQPDLTAKQARFVEEYLIDLNATAAAIRAGYSEKTAATIGHENLRKPKIADAIRVGREKLSKRAQITQKDVLAGLQQEATNYGKGSSHSARVTAWVWIGKHLGMFTERAEVKDETRVQRYDISHFSDDELDTLDRLLQRAGVTTH